MKILVTGGSGYLGTHVCRFFNADDFSRRTGHDILNVYDLRIVSDYDVVIHLAAHLDKDPATADLCFRTNAEGAANVVKYLKPNAAFIYASTKDVYGFHANSQEQVSETCSTEYSGHSAFEWSKLIGERYVEYFARRNDVRACIFRMSTIYARPSEGNENGFVTHYVESVKRGWRIHLPLDGQPVRDILHVDDFSRACQLFIDSAHASGLYNLGGGPQNALSLREIVTLIGKQIEREPIIVDAGQLAPNVPLRYVSDLTKIGEQLAWQPQIGIAEGIRSLL